MSANQPSSLKTIDVRPDRGTIIKPGELIDVVEMSPLTLADRRIYNLLLAHAWDRIDQAVTHVLAKRDLRGSRDANDRVGEGVERLMAAIARLEIRRDGKLYTRRVQLLGATDEGKEDDGLLYYRFPPELRTIIRKSSIFARLRTEVIFHLTSKYSLALYEIVQKRGNLDWKHSEELDLDRFRQMLGVEPGKLPAFRNLNQKAIQPAVAEVNGLSDFGCKVEPMLTGRKVVKIKLSWWKKNVDELQAAYRELQAAKVGRKARLKGTVEHVVPPLAKIADAAAEDAFAQKIRDAMRNAYEQIAAAVFEPRTSTTVPEGTLAEKKAVLEGLDLVCQRIAAVAAKVPPEAHGGEAWDAVRTGLDFCRITSGWSAETLRGLIDEPDPK